MHREWSQFIISSNLHSISCTVQSFDGEGNLQNVLRDQEGFEPKDLAGTLTLKKGYIDDKKSWMALYGKETKYNFILDEFREIKPGYLFGITFLVPTKKGDLSFFECGLVRLGECRK